MNPDNFIVYLPEAEKAWWRDVIKKFRGEHVKEPKFYAKEIIDAKGLTKENIAHNLDEVISSTREEVWQLYLIDEAKFHAAVLTYLFKTRELPRDILIQLLRAGEFSNLNPQLSSDEFNKRISELIGEYAGRVMPYIYDLSLSTTQSRRTRAGQTFERLIESLMDVFEYPYDTQSSVGTEFFTKHGLGKKVDLLVPGAEKYIQNRSKSAVVTAKTTLRERWQEVAEEISRTNVPHIYLLTVDEDITQNVTNTINRYNITLIIYGRIKDAKFPDQQNVQSFENFFTYEMPHVIEYWNR